MNPTKLFISHASEDKADFVDPLVDALRKRGFEVWYDKIDLTMGDSLFHGIGQGLRGCDFGVVVLSPNFFKKKKWVEGELDGLFAIETTEKKVILPIWKDVGEYDVKAYSPMLAGRLGVPTTNGVEFVVSEIQRAVQAAGRMAEISRVGNALSKFKELDKEIGGRKTAERLASSTEGVRIVAEAVTELVASLRGQVERLAAEVENLQIRMDEKNDLQLTFAGSYRLRFVLRYENSVINSIERAELRLLIYQNLDPLGRNFSKRNNLRQKDFEPRFHHSGKLIWRSTNSSQEFTTEQLQERFLKDAFYAFKKLDEKAAKRKR